MLFKVCLLLRNVVSIRTILIFALLVSTLYHCSFCENIERPVWPLHNSRSLSSTFGEYRPGHIHMGLDIRSRNAKGEAVIGLPVYAVGDGYIERIKIKTTGYGKALYLKLDDGSTAVYAHLDSFIPELEEYVLNLQWTSQSYFQDLYIPAEKFKFSQGDIIAYSGRSATKYPHLHFEIRSPSNRALNPLSQGFSVADNRPPVVKRLAVIGLSPRSEIDGDCLPKTYKVYGGSDGIYYLSGRPRVAGKAGFALECFDQTDSAPNAVSVYRIELILDNQTIFETQFDSCDYESYLQVEIDRDPYLNRQGTGVFQRLFRIAGNEMPFYRGDGILEGDEYDAGEHRLLINVEDIYGNSVQLRGKVVFTGERRLSLPDKINNFTCGNYNQASFNGFQDDLKLDFFDKYLRIGYKKGNPHLQWVNNGIFRINFSKIDDYYAGIMPWSVEFIGHNYLVDAQGKIFKTYNIAMVTPLDGGVLESLDRQFQVIFPPGGVFDTLYAAVEELPLMRDDYDFAHPIAYSFHPRWVPLKRVAELRWNTDNPDIETGIYYLEDGVKPVFLGNTIDSVSIKAGCLNLGTFVIITDTVPPHFRLTNMGKINRDDIPKFNFNLIDTLSGIDHRSIEAFLDGEWILAEYDAPRNAVYVRPRNPLPPGRHILKFRAADRSGNESVQEYEFRVTE